MDYTPETEFMNQSQFAKRWHLSRQHISRLVRAGLPVLGGLIDVPAADRWCKRNGVGVLNMPRNHAEHEKYLKRVALRDKL